MPAENIADTQMRLLKLQFPGDPGFLPDLMAKAKITDYSRYGKNLLTANQASLETDTTGWINLSNSTIGRSTAQAADGIASLSMTAVSAADMYAVSAPFTTVSVVPGGTYTGVASYRAATTGRTVRVILTWATAADVYISEAAGATLSDTTTGWTQAIVSGTAPANAAYAKLVTYVAAPALGEVHYVDRAGIFAGNYAAGLWLPPGAITGRNLLTPNQASVETNTTGFGGAGNTNIARNTTQAADGTASLSLTSIAAGNVQAVTSTGGSGVAVTPGVTYTATVSTKAASVSRSTLCQLFWYQSNGSFITSSNSAGTVNNTSTWTAVTVTATAPANAAFAAVAATAVGTAGAGEVHYADKWGLFEGNVNYWTAP